MAKAQPTNRAARRLAAAGRPVYVSITETAAILDVDPRTVRNMLNDGRLRGYKLGNFVLRLRLDEIESAMTPYAGGAE